LSSDWQVSLITQWRGDPKLAAVTEIIRAAQAGDATLATADQRVR
jgi:hypothetical protein